MERIAAELAKDIAAFMVDEPWTIPEEWSDPEDSPGAPIRYEPSKWRTGVKGVHRDLMGGKGKRSLGSQQLVALKPGSQIQGGDLGRVSYGVKHYKDKIATWWGDMTQADYKAQFYKAEPWEVYPRDFKKGTIFYIEPGRGWSDAAGLRRVHRIEVKQHDWIAYGKTVYWVDCEWPVPGGGWSRYGITKAMRIGAGGSWETSVFHKPAKTKADVAISAVPGVRWSAEQLDAMMLTPAKDPGTPIQHRVKGYKDDVRHLDEEHDAVVAEVAQAHAALPHVRRRAMKAPDDGSQPMVWPFWWTNYNLTDEVKDESENTQELFMIDWTNLNKLVYNLTKRLGFQTKDKMVVNYEDPPRYGFSWFVPRADNPWTFGLSEPVDFPQGFYPEEKLSKQRFALMSDSPNHDVVASRSRGDIRDAQGRRAYGFERRPWLYWRFWPKKTQEPFIIEGGGGLEDLISTDFFDAQRYSRAVQRVRSFHIPLYQYLWGHLENAKNHEGDFRALLLEMAMPKSDAALVPIRQLSRNALAYTWTQSSMAVRFLKSIDWDERYDPKEDWENEDITDREYDMLRKNSIRLRMEAKLVGTRWTPATDKLWEQLDPMVQSITKDIQSCQKEWERRREQPMIGIWGDKMMMDTNMGKEKLELLRMPSEVSGVEANKQTMYPLRGILAEMRVDVRIKIETELSTKPKDTRDAFWDPQSEVAIRWGVELRELVKHLWRGVKAGETEAVVERYLYPVLQELHLYPSQVVKALPEALGPKELVGTSPLTFNQMSYRTFPEIFNRLMKLPGTTRSRGWNEFAVDMQPLLTELAGDSGDTAYGMWLSGEVAIGEDVEDPDMMAMKLESAYDSGLEDFDSAPMPTEPIAPHSISRAGPGSPAPPPTPVRRSTRLRTMARKDYSEAVDPKDTNPHPDEHWLVYEARLKDAGYTRRQIEDFGHAQYSQRPSPAGSVVDPDEDAPSLPPVVPVVAAAPPVAAALPYEPIYGLFGPPEVHAQPAVVLSADEWGGPMEEDPGDFLDIPEFLDDPAAEMPPLERAPLVFKPLEIIAQAAQALAGLVVAQVPVAQSGRQQRVAGRQAIPQEATPIPRPPTTTSDFIVPVTVAIVFFIIASQL